MPVRWRNISKATAKEEGAAGAMAAGNPKAAVPAGGINRLTKNQVVANTGEAARNQAMVAELVGTEGESPRAAVMAREIHRLTKNQALASTGEAVRSQAMAEEAVELRIIQTRTRMRTVAGAMVEAMAK